MFTNQGCSLWEVSLYIIHGPSERTLSVSLSLQIEASFIEWLAQFSKEWETGVVGEEKEWKEKSPAPVLHPLPFLVRLSLPLSLRPNQRHLCRPHRQTDLSHLTDKTTNSSLSLHVSGLHKITVKSIEQRLWIWTETDPKRCVSGKEVLGVVHNYRHLWKRTQRTLLNDPLPKAYSKMLIFFKVKIINSNIHCLRVGLLLTNSVHHALIVLHLLVHNHRQNYWN